MSCGEEVKQAGLERVVIVLRSDDLRVISLMISS
eukprot:SAG11_NODE_13028_length_673_cov_1.632404_1_plen_33_part_10